MRKSKSILWECEIVRWLASLDEATKYASLINVDFIGYFAYLLESAGRRQVCLDLMSFNVSDTSAYVPEDEMRRIRAKYYHNQKQGAVL